MKPHPPVTRMLRGSKLQGFVLGLTLFLFSGGVRDDGVRDIFRGLL